MLEKLEVLLLYVLKINGKDKFVNSDKPYIPMLEFKSSDYIESLNK